MGDTASFSSEQSVLGSLRAMNVLASRLVRTSGSQCFSNIGDGSRTTPMASPANVGARGRVVLGPRAIGDAGGIEVELDLVRDGPTSWMVEVEMRRSRLDNE
jgi:hypothetical protein